VLGNGSRSTPWPLCGLSLSLLDPVAQRGHQPPAGGRAADRVGHPGDVVEDVAQATRMQADQRRSALVASWATAARTSSTLTAQTRHRSWVTITSGARAASSSTSTS
jgi:hypothetical protein